MPTYSNYGYFDGSAKPSQILVQPKSRTQVYQATHEGGHQLPFMNRSFISFSYGGKDIEEFNMIAVSDGDRMQRDAYASFEDLTSTYPTLTGQFYWGSYYRNNKIHFNLVTDGSTQRQLDDFKRWFIAGKTKELILAEHPNRAIMARVAATPTFSLIPFESPTQIKLDGAIYNTSTTLYKGEIDLEMVMDDPYWYAKLNIFGKKDSDGIYRDTWLDVTTGQMRNVLEVPDAIKIIYEDGIPIASMIQHTMLFGANIFATVEYQIHSKIIDTINQQEYQDNASIMGYYNNGIDKGVFKQEGNILVPWDWYSGAVIASFDDNGQYVEGGCIAGATMNDIVGIEFLEAYQPGRADSTSVSFYYTGTAPSPTILKFKLYPIFDNQGYITSPANNYSTNLASKNQYNTITIEGQEEIKQFKFTTPNIYTSFNQIIRIFDNPEIIKKEASWATVRELIRETVWHPEIRAWANRVIDIYDDEDGQGLIDHGGVNNIDNTASIREQLKQRMQYFFRSISEPYTICPVELSFNAKTGEAFGTFQHRSCIGKTSYDKDTEWETYCTDEIKVVKENVGDMVKSKYLIIEERNYPNSDNQIVQWSRGTDYAHRLYHDITNGLHNIYVDYQNLYL